MMADEYSYPLLIRLEEPNIPRLKIKLVKYFQSKKANGGDCEVEHENGSRTATLRFRREEDQQNVLVNKLHQISLEKGVLKLTVHSLTGEGSSQETPSDNVNEKLDVAATDKLSSTDESSAAAKVERDSEGKEDDTANEDLCYTSALLGNIPNNINQEVLEMLVENIVKIHDSTSSCQSFTLEVLPDISSAVVTFQSVKENIDFLARCPQNKMFTKKGLSVRPLEVTNKVLVDDIHNCSEEHLHLYFENEGGDVEDVILNKVEQSAVITFKDHRAFEKIIKKMHSIKNKEIRVYPYYKSLGRALYGKDKPSLKPPAAISEHADSAVLRYLTHNKSAAETICSEMEKHFCNVTLCQTTVSLSPASSLLKQKDAKVIIKGWTDTVKSAFAQSVSKFKSLKFHPDSEVWKESEEKIREMLLNEDVVVVPDKASGVLSVAGLVGDVNKLENSLFEIINKIEKRVRREKIIRSEELQVSPSMFHLLHQDGLEDKLLRVYPELKMSPESPKLKITGLGEEIFTASKAIFDAVLALKRQNLEVDNYVLELLKDEQQEELTDALLTSHQINAAFDISGNRVQLVAVSDRDLCDAQAHLTQLLTSQYISVEDSNVLKKPEWQQLVSQSEQANSKPCRTRINTTAQQVVVSGCKDNVIKVSRQLDDFLTQNAHIEEIVVVKADAVTEYLKCFNTHWLEKVKDKVKVSYRNGAICLSGSRVDVAHCKTVVEGAVSSVVFDSLSVCKCGVKKLFQENEAMYVTSIKNKTGCMVQLVDKIGGQDNFVLRQVPTALYQPNTNASMRSLQTQAFFGGGNTEKPKKEKDFVIESLKVEATCFHICGDMQANIDLAKNWINDKISQEHQSMEIEDNAICSFSDADRQRIVDMQKTMDISIKTESNKPKATITIEGLSRDVLKANNEIIKMLSKVRDEEELNRKVELVNATADWQYQQVQSFDKMTNFHLEEALQQNLPTVKVTVQGQDYTVTMPRGPATDSQGNILEIKRIDKLKDVAEHWVAMHPNVASQVFPLQAGTQEYDEIQYLFQPSCKRTIIKIERIQNPGLWKSFQVKKHDMELRNGHQNNERRLFHGTTEDIVATINDRGFNRSYAGKNAALYGNGTYFSVPARHAASDTYSRPNQNGEKFVYVCRVLTGDYTLGQKGMVIPPMKGTGTISTDLYDSVVNNMANPSMFVVFHDSQAYPEYLITFK